MKLEEHISQNADKRPLGYLGPILDPEEFVLQPLELDEGVYALMANTPSKDNNGLIIGETSALVVDAGFNGAMARKIQEVSHQLTSKPIRYLVNTTYHGDHTFGNYAFSRDVTIISSSKNKESMRELEREKRIRSSNLRGNIKAISDVAVWRRPDIVFQSYMELDLGGQIVQLWHFGPGNAPGDTIVYVPSAKVAWTGNYLPAAGIPPMLIERGPNPYIASLQCLQRTLDLETIVPGHGPIGPAKPALENLVAYLKEVRDEVRASIAEKRSLEETLSAYSMSDRLTQPADRAQTQGMQTLIANLHRLNVLATYRMFEADTSESTTG